MPLIKKTDRTHVQRVDLPAEGEWVDLRTKISRGEQEDMRRRIFAGERVKPGDDDITVSAEALMESYTWGLLEATLVDWSFDEEITPEAIRQLDLDSYEAITEALNGFYPARTEEERGNSERPGQTTSTPNGVAAEAESQPLAS